MLQSEKLEIIAQAIHEEYVENQTAKGETAATNPALVDWVELPEDFKESNRNQARHVVEKLKAIGCDIEPVSDQGGELFQFTPDEVETLARMEHERWTEERLAAGWKYAPGPKDIKKKTSPWLVPYEELPEEQREKDRGAVRGIPKFLAKIGFEIERV